MYTRVTKEQFEIRNGVYIHTPTEAEFAPNPSSEGSMVIYTGNIGSRLASGQLFAYAEVLQVMKVLWQEISQNQGHGRRSSFGRVTHNDEQKWSGLD